MAPVGDTLMDSVHIYDNVLRKFAGFSKVLEDITGRAPHRDINNYDLSFFDFLYVSMVHRFTGSGASFESDHGYRNSCVKKLLNECVGWEEYVEFFKCWDEQQPWPIFTSIGNQPPAMPKTDVYNKSSTNYFVNYLPAFVCEAEQVILQEGTEVGIRELTDWALAWNTKYGLKKFHFVYTAWAMDIAEYHPDKIHKNSQVYYGKNCIEALDLMYTGKGSYDERMEDICNHFGELPLDAEDRCCDAIRYWENYIPKGKTYEDLDRQSVFNQSLIQNHPKGRQKWMLGTDYWKW
jgi:hypothetical protein